MLRVLRTCHKQSDAISGIARVHTNYVAMRACTYSVISAYRLKTQPGILPRCYSSHGQTVEEHAAAYQRLSPCQCIEANDEETAQILGESFHVYRNFISEAEEASLFAEIEPYLKRLRYENSHWDDAIHGYRETERKNWRENNQPILQRVRDLAFPPGQPQLAFVHVLDLEKTGYIKPHIDSARFCGSTIAGLSLLSTAVMRLVSDKNKEVFGDILVERRSLYIMTGASRYDFTHEILGEGSSKFKGEPIPRDRRISVICRNEPEPSSPKPN